LLQGRHCKPACLPACFNDFLKIQQAGWFQDPILVYNENLNQGSTSQYKTIENSKHSVLINNLSLPVSIFSDERSDPETSLPRTFKTPANQRGQAGSG